MIYRFDSGEIGMRVNAGSSESNRAIGTVLQPFLHPIDSLNPMDSARRMAINPPRSQGTRLTSVTNEKDTSTPLPTVRLYGGT